MKPRSTTLSSSRLVIGLSVERAVTPPTHTSTGLNPTHLVKPATDVAHAIVVGGPGRGVFTADGPRHVANQLSERIPRCELIVNEGELPHADEPVRKGLMKSLAQARDERVLVFFEAHGSNKKGRFVTELDRKSRVASESLFRDMGKSHDAPIEVFMTCCYGKAALDNAYHLPKGSVVVVLSPHDKGVRGQDIRNLRANLDALTSVSAFGLLLTYCATSLGVETPPTVFMPDGTILSLGDRLHALLGTHFSEADRQMLHEQLDPLVGSDMVDEAMEKITEGSRLDAADYGLGLAVAAVLNGIRTERPTAVADAAGRDEPVPTPVQLNLEHPCVNDMLTHRGNHVDLPCDAMGVCSETLNEIYIVINGETVQLQFDRWEAGAAQNLSIIGSPRAVAALQQAGLLSVAATPQQEGKNPAVVDMLKNRGTHIDLADGIMGVCSETQDEIYIMVNSNAVLLRFKGSPGSGPLSVASIQGAPEAVKALREKGILRALEAG